MDKLLILLLFFLSLPLYAKTEWTEVPFQKEQWQVLQFNRIPPHHISFKKDQLEINVEKSAAPLIYPFPQERIIEEIELDLTIKGKLSLKKIEQGQKTNDDFLFRLGLVYQGAKKLNFFQRLSSPTWVKKLFALAGDKTGIENITFYNVYSDQRLANKSREHPFSELLIENYSIPAAENIRTQFKTKNVKKVLAFWISSDGDDTDSSFQVIINKIRYR